MKKDTINDLFLKLKSDFDTETPNIGHENRFLEKLQQQSNSVVDLKPKSTKFWRPFLAVAATLALCFGLLTFMQQRNNTAMELASVSPELYQTQSFFIAAIEQELVTLEAQRTPETEEIINDAMRELKNLEDDYQHLKIDLTKSGNDKRVVYAMISNFQNRIDVLKTVLKHIEEVNTLKNNQNENSITI